MSQPPRALGDTWGAQLLLPIECSSCLGLIAALPTERQHQSCGSPRAGKQKFLARRRGESFSPCCPQPGGTGRSRLGRHRRPGQRSPQSAALWGAGDGWEELTQPDEPSLLHSPTTKQSLQEVYNPPLTLLGVMQEGSISQHYPPNSASLCCRPALPGSEPDQLGLVDSTSASRCAGRGA